MKNIPKFIERLAQTQDSISITNDLKTRVLGTMIGIVVDNKDPEGLRRIKVEFPEFENGKSNWFFRLHSSPLLDEPLPRLGDTVAVFFLNADITQGFYLVLQNFVNKPLKKVSEANDYYREIPGVSDVKIANARRLVADSYDAVYNKLHKVKSLNFEQDIKALSNINVGLNHTLNTKGINNIISGAATNITSGAVTSINGAAIAFSAASGGITLATPGNLTKFGANGIWDIGGNAINVLTKTANFLSSRLLQRGEQLASLNMVKDYVLSVTGKGSPGRSRLWNGGSIPRLKRFLPKQSSVISGFKKVFTLPTPLPLPPVPNIEDLGIEFNFGFELEVDDVIYITYEFNDTPSSRGTISLNLSNGNFIETALTHDVNTKLGVKWDLNLPAIELNYIPNMLGDTLKLTNVLLVRL